MRVTIVTCVFPPEPVVSARTSAELAAALLARGHEVRVIAPFPSRPAGRHRPADRGRLYRRTRGENGCDVVRCFSLASPASTVRSRFLENISFGVSSALALLFSRRPHVVFANTWPLGASALTVAACRLRRIPIVGWVQDLYPESLVSQSRLSPGGAAFGMLRRIDDWVVRSQAHTLVVSEQFEQAYQRRSVSHRAMTVVPNWIADAGPAGVDRAKTRSRLGIGPSSFLVVYGGNVGVASGIQDVVEAFGGWQGSDGTHLLVAGDGACLGACSELAARSGGRVSIHSPWPAEETHPVLGAADLLLLPTSGEQSSVSVPSKVLNYMMAARPILAQALPGSALERMVASAGCGWTVPPGDPHALVAAVEKIRTLPGEAREAHGQRGRAYVQAELGRERWVGRVVDILERAGGRREEVA